MVRVRVQHIQGRRQRCQGRLELMRGAAHKALLRLPRGGGRSQRAANHRAARQHQQHATHRAHRSQRDGKAGQIGQRGRLVHKHEGARRDKALVRIGAQVIVLIKTHYIAAGIPHAPGVDAEHVGAPQPGGGTGLGGVSRRLRRFVRGRRTGRAPVNGIYRPLHQPDRVIAAHDDLLRLAPLRGDCELHGSIRQLQQHKGAPCRD